MGLLFNDLNEVREKVSGEFGNIDNYLIAIKHNDVKNGIAKLIVSNLLYILDSNRTFIIFFDEKGIHEKEMGRSIKGDFLLMPWHEIENFEVIEKNNKAIIEMNHLGKKVGYKIPFKGKLFRDNSKNFGHLKDKEWNALT